MNNMSILADAGDELESTPAGVTDVVEDAVTESVIGEDGKPIPADKEPKKKPMSPWQFAPFIVLFVLMYFMLIK